VSPRCVTTCVMLQWGCDGAEGLQALCFEDEKVFPWEKFGHSGRGRVCQMSRTCFQRAESFEGTREIRHNAAADEQERRKIPARGCAEFVCVAAAIRIECWRRTGPAGGPALRECDTASGTRAKKRETDSVSRSQFALEGVSRSARQFGRRPDSDVRSFASFVEERSSSPGAFGFKVPGAWHGALCKMLSKGIDRRWCSPEKGSLPVSMERDGRGERVAARAEFFAARCGGHVEMVPKAVAGTGEEQSSESPSVV